MPKSSPPRLPSMPVDKSNSMLFHATYEEHLPSILRWGLGAAPDMPTKNYEDSRQGVVYLATSPQVAESYAESSDLVPEEWLDSIVVLCVDTKHLDTNLLRGDANVLLDEGEVGDTLEYHGTIPASAISFHKPRAPEHSPSLNPT